MLKQNRFHRVVYISLHCKLQLASQDWRRNRVPALEDLSTLGPEKTNFEMLSHKQGSSMLTSSDDHILSPNLFPSFQNYQRSFTLPDHSMLLAGLETVADYAVESS